MITTGIFLPKVVKRSVFHYPLCLKSFAPEGIYLYCRGIRCLFKSDEKYQRSVKSLQPACEGDLFATAMIMNTETGLRLNSVRQWSRETMKWHCHLSENAGVKDMLCSCVLSDKYFLPVSSFCFLRALHTAMAPPIGPFFLLICCCGRFWWLVWQTQRSSS